MLNKMKVHLFSFNLSCNGHPSAEWFLQKWKTFSYSNSFNLKHEKMYEICIIFPEKSGIVKI